eukprot:scaffold124847_cov54-Phaeocystis_antarctica.AAC.2
MSRSTQPPCVRANPSYLRGPGVRAPLGGARERGHLVDQIERQTKLAVCSGVGTLCAVRCGEAPAA